MALTQKMTLTATLKNIEATLHAGDAKKALHLWLEAVTEMQAAFLQRDPPSPKKAQSFQSIADQQITLFERVLTGSIHALNRADVCLVLQKKGHISSLYAISTYGSSLKARDTLLSDNPFASDNISSTQAALALLLCSYEDFGALESNLIEKLPADLQLGFILAFMGNPFTYTPDHEKWRSWLFDQLEILPDSLNIVPWAPLVTAAAMSCSYASVVGKHNVRAKINKMLAHRLQKYHTPKFDNRPVKRRPKLLIFAEQMQPDHAMYRCYAPSIRSLKNKFDVTMIVVRGEDDGRLSSIVDVLDTSPFEKNIKPYVEKIIHHEPDIIYYPSVGMSLNSLVAASIRMAPIQIMTNGHPATSMSPTMDYMVLVDEVFGGAELFSEKVILRSKGAHYVRRKVQSPIRVNIRQQPKTIRIAVPAYLRKVNAYFLEACQEIASQSKKKVQFVFLPNRVGTQHWEAKQKLETLLPAEVLQRTDYTTYIQNLNQCDIHLSTFPFGSANGIVDSALLGLPIVNLIGKEPHSRLDGNLVNRYDQPSWLTANTVDQYIEAAVKLVDNDALRASISNSILKSNPASHLLVDEGVACHDFAELIYLLYEKHKKIEAKDQKVWDIDELNAI